MTDTTLATDSDTRISLGAPLPIRGRTARNRIVMAPMSVCYADPDGHVSTAEIEHYGRRARGGAGVVIVENAAISDSARQLPRQTMISGDRFLPGLTSLAAAIHDGGALALVQIVHAGRYAGPWNEYGRRRRLAPSAVEFPLLPGRDVIPQEMTVHDIAEVIADFANAARRARRAGFDGVHLHGAQGFLLSQFLSPRMNHRTDEWGGSFDNRARLAIEVTRAVRQALGDDAILGYHLLTRELLPQGITIEESTELARRLTDEGVDLLIPVTATFEDLHTNRDLMSRPGFQLDDISAIAATVDVPVVANGTLGDPQDAIAVVAERRASAVGLARALLVDPDWPLKVLAGRGADIRTCPCAPPQCIRTQLGGVTCHHWPAAAQERGYLGYLD